MRLRRVVFIASAASLASAPAHAQGAFVLDAIIQQFQLQAAGWEATLAELALRTFGILAGIELAWAAFKLAFRGADVSEWLAELVNQILFLGFFLALLQNASTWGTAIVSSFRQAGAAATGGGTNPSAVFTSGVSIAQKVLAEMTLMHPATSVGFMIAAIIIEICFALIAAFMVVTLVQSYIVIAAGVINMAFGGSRWTKDIAVSTVRYTVSVGAKLMMLQLIVSIGQNLIMNWSNQFNFVNNAGLLILIGSSVVMLAIVKIVPDEFQRIVGGASLSSGSALVGAAAAVGGAVAGVGLGMAGAGRHGGSGFPACLRADGRCRCQSGGGEWRASAGALSHRACRCRDRRDSPEPGYDPDPRRRPPSVR